MSWRLKQFALYHIMQPLSWGAAIFGYLHCSYSGMVNGVCVGVRAVPFGELVTVHIAL